MKLHHLAFAGLAAMASLRADSVLAAGTVINSNISQPDGAAPIINYTITNSNLGAIFNSASINYVAQLEAPFTYALANNSSLQALGITTISDLLNSGLVGVSIGQSSNSTIVNQGWNAAINPTTGVLNLEHGPFGYEQWRSSTDGVPHTMQLTYTFGNPVSPDPKLKNIFDFNGNGIVDEDERLHVAEDQPIQNGFEGHDGIFSYYANLPKYQLNVPSDPGDTHVTSLFTQPHSATPVLTTTVQNAQNHLNFTSASTQVLQQLFPVLQGIITHNQAVRQAGVTTPAQLLQSGHVSLALNTTGPEFVHHHWVMRFDAHGHAIATPQSGADPWTNSHAGTPHTLEYFIHLGTTNPMLNPENDPRLANLLDLNGNGAVDAYEEVIEDESPAPAPQILIQTTGSDPIAKPVAAYKLAHPIDTSLPLEQALKQLALTLHVPPPPAEEVELSFQAYPGKVYQVETSLTLHAESWQPQGEAATVLEPQRLTLTRPRGGGRRFYRLNISVE